jgi:ribonuclease VapC
MVVDTSAIMAVLLGEDDADRIIDVLASTDQLFISVATAVEIDIVQFAKNGDQGLRELDLLMSEILPDIVPVTAHRARIASEAFQRSGRGQHPTRLNFGDCFSYALAKETSLPLLFKGKDFSLTDLRAVPY